MHCCKIRQTQVVSSRRNMKVIRQKAIKEQLISSQLGWINYLVPPLAGTEWRFINIDDLTPQSVWRVYGDSFASEKDLIKTQIHRFARTHSHLCVRVCMCGCVWRREWVGSRWLGDKHKSLTSEHGRCQHSYEGNMWEHKLKCTQSARVQSPSLFIYLNVVKPSNWLIHREERDP